MATKSGVITRRDIITDQALEFGGVYAKNVQKAIDANKKMVAGAKALHKVFLEINAIKGNSEFVTYLQNTNTLLLEINTAVSSQNRALRENQTIINGLNTSQTSLNTTRLQQLRVEKEAQRLGIAEAQRKRADISLSEAQRRQSEAAARSQQRQARETANQSSAYVQLQRRRNESQRTLADLLSAENRNIEQVRIAQREYDILDTRLRAVDAAVRNYSRNVGNYRSVLSGMNGTIRELISTFGIATGIALFGTIVKDIFSVIVEFDRQLIAVGKTTNITGEALKQFGRDVVELGDKLDGISVEGLLKSAEIAGQLGVEGTANILKFAQTIEKLKLTSNIISDEQVSNFAKFIEVSSDSFENADRLGSVITALGNSFASTEAEVLSNATEIQKGTAVYKTSAQGILALGAATSALGSEAESSRSAIQSTFAIINNAIAMNKNLAQVLKITGLNQKELKDEFGKDATVVFQKFVKGLSDAKNQGQNLSLVLNELGIKEKRAFTVVGSLAANYGLLERAMTMAGEEYKNNIALNKEMEAATQSISSIIGDIKDKFDAYILSTNDANNGTKTITSTLKFLRDNLTQIINGFLKYGSVVATFIGVQKLWNYITAVWTAVQTAAAAAQARFAVATQIGTAAIEAQAEAAEEATAAQTGLNTATAATPWGLILALISAVVVAYQVFNDELSKHEQLLIRIKEQNEDLNETENKYNADRDANRDESFRVIERQMQLRSAQGENSKKLDDEEIKRKKEVVQAQLDVYTDLKNSEQARTQSNINSSNQRIAQMYKELKAIQDLNDGRGGFSPINRRIDKLKEEIDAEKANRSLQKNLLFENTRITITERKKLLKILSELDIDKAISDAEFKKEESDKERRAREKARREYLAFLKKQENDDFALREFRLKNNIFLNDEIVKNDKAAIDSRIDAENKKNRFEVTLSKETLEHKLRNISLYDDSVRDLSELEIDTLVSGGEIKRELLNEEKLVIEQHNANLVEIEKKRLKSIQDVIDSEVLLIQKRTDSNVAEEERKLNEAIEVETKKFQILNDLESMSHNEREIAIFEHEKKIFDIKKKFALDALKIQIDALDKELAANDAKNEKEQISVELRKKLANDLQKYKTDLALMEMTNFVEDIKAREDLEREFNDRVKDLAFDLADALSNLANSIFEGRINNIDEEIRKNDEYYAKQIELAGNDAVQKKLLEDQAEKGRQKLEEKKRKEQVKQAILNKAMNLAIIASQTAMASIAAFSPPPIGVGPLLAPSLLPLIISVGAVQAATVLATPIPKYKHGRKDGPAEFAEVGDGYVREVVEKQDGRAYITPNVPTLTFLEKGDKVHSSVDEFRRIQKASMMASLAMENKKLNDYQATQTFNYNFDVLENKIEEGISKGFKNAKNNITINLPKSDMAHEIWKFKNTNWRS